MEREKIFETGCHDDAGRTDRATSSGLNSKAQYSEKSAPHAGGENVSETVLDREETTQSSSEVLMMPS